MNRILVIKITSLGDMAHTLPLIWDLRRAYPEAKIDWVADASCADIPRWTVGIDRVIAPPLRGFKKSRKWRDLKAIFGALRQLRREKYDVAIDVHGVYKSAIVGWLSGAPRRFGYAARYLGEGRAESFYTDIFGPHGDATARHKMRLVASRALGYEIDQQEHYELRVPAPAAPLNEDGAPRALLFHATSLDAKKWPAQRWIAVGAELAARGYRVQLPWGSPAEREQSEALAREIPGSVVLPRMTITECAQRVDAAALVVGTDTGFVHLAHALGKPSVMLFTATSREHFGISAPGRAVSVGDRGVVPEVSEVLQAIDEVTGRATAGSCAAPPIPARMAQA
ncbi:lipopolysaccharide heptosyltransferase I [Cupriavidus respiraculi]|uniref:Lipopolysaccharide heptosyltransferase 1 n=1 Tax=Cupriavidus respiraculi TaxID=195930 RepID=A0ABM8XN10_9BURK|nr:lipopolysaccharide heptosyltransferase I [Cupriavidus respiraculi]CAG9181645.1 Lipopolysaccharide heptosyltransferase 1 [Cupriavidus respiraculi]